MSRTPAMVLDYLLSVSPDGDALPLSGQPGAIWPLWLGPLANEISLYEAAAAAMMLEADPGQAVNLLADYQRVLGPDPWGRDALAVTLAEQQALAKSRWVSRYGVRPADFIALAASFGLTVTITEFATTQAGSATAGALLVNSPTQFDFVVKIPAGTALGTAPFSFVEPAITGRAPAHTTPIYAEG